MAVFDADFCTDLTLAEGDDTLWSPPMVMPACEPLDWASVLEEAEARIEEERGRARVAELRREELRWSERDACTRVRSLERQLETCRFKLKLAVTKTASRAMKALERRVEYQDDEIVGLYLSLRRSHEHRERVEARHRDEINWLKQDIDRERSRLAKVHREGERVAESLRGRFDRHLAAARRLVEAREGTIAWLRAQRPAAGGGRAGHGADRVAAGEECRAARRGAGSEGRERRAGRAGREAGRRPRQAALDPQRPVEGALRQQERAAEEAGRERGQQRGAAGHGRTRRPGLRKKKETRDPPEDARICPRCGKPYVANGERRTTLFEIDVEACERTIVRSRWRRACDCASAPREVAAPPAVRLFETTPYGISVWTCMLYERFVCCRPLHRVAAWLADMGLTISPGTLADSIKRFVPLFEPLAEAILAHQNTAALRHADETSWRVQAWREKGRSSRAWLWTSVSPDAVYYHIDPSRSAEVAMKLFGSTQGIVVLVCDRFSAYRKLARELAGKVILQWCWAHQRRSFIDGAAGRVRLRRWCQRWIERIAEIYRLNEARLEHYDPAHPLERQTPAFDVAHARLKKAVDELFATAEAELAGLTDRARRARPLRSLLKHREGLCVFVDKPFVPMDNNRGELSLRFAVIGRRLSFGSDSEKGAGFTATMYSVAGTLAINGIDVRRWLGEWLTACAENGGEPPEDLSPWLPWSMSEARRRELAAAG